MSTANRPESLAIPLRPATPPRMRAPLRKAIDEIVYKGRTQRAAAEAAGMNETSLGRALARKEVAAYVETLKARAALDADQLKVSARAIAIQEGMRLMVEAQSEAVRARMVEFFAGEPRQPLVAVQVNAQAPGGYTYRRPDDASKGQVEDAQEIKDLDK